MLAGALGSAGADRGEPAAPALRGVGGPPGTPSSLPGTSRSAAGAAGRAAVVGARGGRELGVLATARVLTALVTAHALAWQFCQSGAVRGLTYLQRLTVAERAVETGCQQTARLLVTGPGGPEDVGTLGLSL